MSEQEEPGGIISREELDKRIARIERSYRQAAEERLMGNYEDRQYWQGKKDAYRADLAELYSLMGNRRMSEMYENWNDSSPVQRITMRTWLTTLARDGADLWKVIDEWAARDNVSKYHPVMQELLTFVSTIAGVKQFLRTLPDADPQESEDTDG